MFPYTRLRVRQVASSGLYGLPPLLIVYHACPDCATPRYALLAGALPDADDAWLGSFSAGFFALAQKYGVDVVGGDTTKGPRNFCVTVIGELPAGAALRRDGARPGDDVYVSDLLGGAALALAALQRRTTLSAEALSNRDATERME